MVRLAIFCTAMMENGDERNAYEQGESGGRLTGARQANSVSGAATA